MRAMKGTSLCEIKRMTTPMSIPAGHQLVHETKREKTNNYSQSEVSPKHFTPLSVQSDQRQRQQQLTTISARSDSQRLQKWSYPQIVDIYVDLIRIVEWWSMGRHVHEDKTSSKLKSQRIIISDIVMQSIAHRACVVRVSDFILIGGNWI